MSLVTLGKDPFFEVLPDYDIMQFPDMSSRSKLISPLKQEAVYNRIVFLQKKISAANGSAQILSVVLSIFGGKYPSW